MESAIDLIKNLMEICKSNGFLWIIVGFVLIVIRFKQTELVGYGLIGFSVPPIIYFTVLSGICYMSDYCEIHIALHGFIKGALIANFVFTAIIAIVTVIIYFCEKSAETLTALTGAFLYSGAVELFLVGAMIGIMR